MLEIKCPTEALSVYTWFGHRGEYYVAKATVVSEPQSAVLTLQAVSDDKLHSSFQLSINYNS